MAQDHFLGETANHWTNFLTRSKIVMRVNMKDRRNTPVGTCWDTVSRPCHVRESVCRSGDRPTTFFRRLGKVFLGIVALSCCQNALGGGDKQESSETIRFLRVSGSEFVKETEIHLVRTDNRLVVTSITQRGEQTLTVTSRFDSNQELTSAKVTLRRGQHSQSAKVSVTDQTATVVREGNETSELVCPRGVIVTSAPDWTDSYLAVQRFDLTGSPTQEFPGLWIHPTRKPLQLTIKLTRLGSDSVTRGNATEKLDRFLLVLRGGSRYVAWRNRQGQLVRLMTAIKGSGGIVMAGWELATRSLKPQLSSN